MDKGGEMKTRKAGYYWVKYPEYAGDEWIVGACMSNGKSWMIESPIEIFGDGDFTEIDETPITRDAVPSECDTIGITYYQIACETIRDQEKRIKELEAEVAAMKEAIAINDLKTLGRIAQEQAAALWDENDRLKDQIETLQKENEGWDQQAQEVERLREEKRLLVQSLEAHMELAEGENNFYRDTYLYKKALAALQSPSSAKDTPDKSDPRHHIIPDEGWEWKEPLTNKELFDENAALRREIAKLKSSPVSVDINQELVYTLELTVDFCRLHSEDCPVLGQLEYIVSAALSKASSPKQNEK